MSKYTARQVRDWHTEAHLACLDREDYESAQEHGDMADAIDDLLRERKSAKGTPHPDDVAVDMFAFAMKEKLAEARAKGRGGWQDKTDCPQQRLSDMLRFHVEKGDPRDVANFCMFLHQRSESILPSERESAKAAVTDEIAERVLNQYVKNCLSHLDEAPVSLRVEAMRAALEAVAPMLASARVSNLENALRMVVAANAMLSEIEDGKTLYEGSPMRSTLCLLAWSNLNAAIANAKQKLAAAPKPEKE